jgi:hypothetical protein
MTFSKCVSLLDEAKTILKLSLTESELETVITAYNVDTLIVFIDIDYARSYHYNGVRNELLEAVQLFREAGGTIYMLKTLNTNSTIPTNEYNDLRTAIISEPDFDTKTKADYISNDTFIRAGFRKFVFGDKELFNRLHPNERQGDLILNVEETELLELYDDKSPLRNYTSVEYILFYLTVKLKLKAFNI